MPRTRANFRLPQATSDQLDEILRRAREAGEPHPASRTDAVVMAVHLLHAAGADTGRRGRPVRSRGRDAGG